MQITLQIPDQVYKEDSDFKRYFEGLQLMVNRMAMSHYKYGIMSDNVEKGCDDMTGGRERLFMYDGVGESARGKKGNTGNTENLLDAANFFIIEWLFPRHPKAKFRPQDSSESPGLAWKDDGVDTLRKMLIK